MASSCFGSEVDFALDTLRSLRERLSQGVRSEGDRLDLMVDLCGAFDELDEAMMLGADLPVAWKAGRTVRTVEQLAALPDESVVRNTSGAVERDGRQWYSPGLRVSYDNDDIELPVLLLWHPDWDAC